MIDTVIEVSAAWFHGTVSFGCERKTSWGKQIIDSIMCPCYKYRFEGMKDAMVQLQMAIPALKTNASIIAALRKDEDVLMELKTYINLPETSYQEKASLKYGKPSLSPAIQNTN